MKIKKKATFKNRTTLYKFFDSLAIEQKNEDVFKLK